MWGWDMKSASEGSENLIWHGQESELDHEEEEMKDCIQEMGRPGLEESWSKTAWTDAGEDWGLAMRGSRNVGSATMAMSDDSAEEETSS